MRTKFLLLVILFFGKIFSQGNSFSLQQALDYAYLHNPNQLNAELDAKSQVYYKRQIMGIGLPQLNGSVDVKDYVELPTQLLPGQFFGAPPGSFIPVKFGTKYNATAGVSVSQLIFSNDYLVGMQAAKELMNLSQKNILRTKTETASSVAKAYYSALINKERIKLLDANVARLKKILDDTRALNKAGFVEKIDVDRLEVTYNNLVTEKEKVTKLIGLSETVLKFQMGFKISDAIIITDSLNTADQAPLSIAAASQSINFAQRPEYSLLETQQKLNVLNYKRFRQAGIPTLVGYGSFSEQAQRQKFDFFDASQKWFPIGIIGATLSVPIFDGRQTYNRAMQAKMTVLKTKNNLFNLEQAISMEVSMASISYENALQSVETQKRNMELAKNILEVSNKKYTAGVGSNLEIVTAETSLKEAETNYFNSLYDLYIAKIDYQKAIGTLVVK
ncbi:MAG: TolC family protein [Bacteroidia bacterium]|nr:TolC family protein [Bacteroidia bacterium]